MCESTVYNSVVTLVQEALFHDVYSPENTRAVTAPSKFGFSLYAPYKKKKPKTKQTKNAPRKQQQQQQMYMYINYNHSYIWR